VQGVNEWRDENEWPLSRTRWTKFFLRQNGRLSEEPPVSNEEPDHFTNRLYWDAQEPAPCLKYTIGPFPKDVETTGPMAFYLHGSLSTEDANWMVDVKDVSPDGSERVVTKGWLKASHRAVDPKRSKPYQPFHLHLENVPVTPGEILEYAIEVREGCNVFKAGHSLQLVIKGEDSPYEDRIWYHLANMSETRHNVHHDVKHPSHLLLPIIPR
jgi:uncharacterized protein